MKRSDNRILTTHTGSLPRSADLMDLLNANEAGETLDAPQFERRVKQAIAEIVRRQADTGIDVIGDGEHSKVSWMAYARARLSGLEEIDSPVRYRGATRDLLAFPGTYEDMKLMLGARSPAIVPKRKVRPQAFVCSGPVTYIGQDEVRRDIDNLKAALQGVTAAEAFMTAISPSNLRALLRKSILPDRRGISGGVGRRDACRVQGDRRFPASSCKSTTRAWPRTTIARSTPRSRIAANSSRFGSRR